MRKQLEELKESLNYIDLDNTNQTLRMRNILMTIIKLLDQALPIDKSDDD